MPERTREQDGYRAQRGPWTRQPILTAVYIPRVAPRTIRAQRPITMLGPTLWGAENARAANAIDRAGSRPA